MALKIRKTEAEKLAGETRPEALTQSLPDRAQFRWERPRKRLADELDEIALHCAEFPMQDSRTPEEILGYDENALPG